MANRGDNEREMIKQDTEADRDSTTKASHENSGGSSRSGSEKNMDFDLEDDIDSIEER